MNPDRVKCYYNSQAIILLAIPVFVTLHKLSGHEINEHDVQFFSSNLGIEIMAAGTTAGISFFMLKYSQFCDPTINISKYQDFPEVFAIIEKLCNKLEIDVPEISFLESSIPNAFVYKRDKRPVLVLTIPLIEILDNKELETVLAHELAHIRNKDLELRKYSLFMRFALFLNPLVHLIEPFISRSREYLADETAAWITGSPNKLASALLKIEEYSNVYKERKISTSMQPEFCFCDWKSCAPYIFSRSPSTEKRIKRLIDLNSKIFAIYHSIKY